jgi:murein DD-endopeptidase MepM/ murein hydrolase activator NlpD
VTNNAFLIKIIPPEGYNVYRLHLSRTAAAGIALALILVVAGALGFHAWQLHVAEQNVAELRLQTADQGAKLRAIDKQAESLAGQLRDIQHQDDQIRKLLGVGSAGTSHLHPTHGMISAPSPASAPTVAGVQAQLAQLTHASQRRLSDSRRFDRLAQRVLNLRRVALAARERMIAALPSLNPVGGGIAAGYGWRINPWPEFHRGLDLEADYGTPVHAAADGVVGSAGWDGGFGNKIDVDHENGYHTWYAHLSRFAVTAGAHVRKGEIIGFVGATGEATGPHLHYQIMLGGQAIDPAPYLAGVPAKVLATLPSSGRVQ